MKTILLFSIILLFFGCKTPRNSVITGRSEIHERAKSEVKKDENTLVKIVENITVDEDCEITTITTTVVYDTDKPVDSITRKPPVKSETKTESKTGTKVKTEVAKKTDENCDKKEVAKSNSEKNTTEKKAEESKVAPDPKRWRYILGIILASAAILAGGYFLMVKKILPLIQRLL